jgi:hypothetical protein
MRVQAFGVPVLLTMAVTTPAPLLEAYTITVPLESATAKLLALLTESLVYRDILNPARPLQFLDVRRSKPLQIRAQNHSNHPSTVAALLFNLVAACA